MTQGTVLQIKQLSLAAALVGMVLAGDFGCSSASTAKPQAASEHSPLLAVVAADAEPAEHPTDWKKEIGDIVAPATGLIADLNAKEQVYTITVPRTDVDLNIDGMRVPTAAGIASKFYFYRCDCGKMSVLGEFIVLDYEANDVIDALRAGAVIRVTAVNSIAIGDRPHLLSVRFHGEGEATPLAKLIKEALRWTGEERMKPAK